MLNHRQQGISLIELIIGVALLAILMSLGMPQFASFLSNARLRTTAESVATGLSLARAEAVKSNADAEFVLTADEPVADTVNAITANTAGPHWVVRTLDRSTGSYTFIEGKLGAEGSGGRSANIQVQIASAGTGAYAGTVVYNGYGGLKTAETITYQVTNPNGGLCAAAGGPMRCLNIVVTPGGQIRTCDPAVNPVTAPNDTRAC